MYPGTSFTSQAEKSFAIQRLLFHKACNPMLDELISDQKRELALLRSRMVRSGRHLVVLLDVEGTTTPLPFVTSVLYPASLEHLRSFLDKHYEKDPIVTEAVKLCAAEHQPLASAVLSGNRQSVIDAAHTRLSELIGVNSKVSYLKTIQGLIWKNLYMSRGIEGHLFEDTKDLLLNCSTLPNASVWIYSSGSVQAQQLLFRYSTLGDMTPYIRGYCDPPLVGSKTVAASYAVLRQHIEKQIGRPCSIVFVTDSVAEIMAAQQGGMDALVMSIRPLNAPVTLGDFSAMGEQVCSLCSLAHLIPRPRQSALGEVRHIYDQVDPYRRMANRPLKSFL